MPGRCQKRAAGLTCLEIVGRASRAAVSHSGSLLFRTHGRGDAKQHGTKNIYPWARLPHAKEDAIDALRSALEAKGITTNGWWERQLSLCLLGTLLMFGWEKALGGDDELGWWCDRAREGARHL